MATIYRTDGTSEEVEPKNGTDFTLDELQAVVDGYIEIVPSRDGRIIVLNEEGKLRELPVNLAASVLYGNRYDFIVGDVLVCNDDQIR